MASLVSVIIPNYNHAPFLKERIESVLHQHYRDFEIIILDDCSTDNSRAMIEKYRSTPEISAILYNKINSGSTFLQWQKGISQAKGKIIWIAESDDVANPDFLSTLVPLMEKENTDIIFSGSYIIDENSNPIDFDPDLRLKESLILEKDYIKIDPLRFIKSSMAFGNRMYNASSVLFKKDLWNEISKDFINMKACGDWLCWLHMLRKSKSVIWCPKKLNYFRNHTNKVTPKSILSGLAFEEKKYIVDHIISLNIIGRFSKFLIAGKNYYEIRCTSLSPEKNSYIINLWKETYSFPKLSIAAYLLYDKLRKVLKLNRYKGIKD